MIAYEYTDGNGTSYVKKRREPKGFFFDPEPSNIRIPYLLHTFSEFNPNDDILYLTEGEKDAESLYKCGYWATTLDTHSEEIMRQCIPFLEGCDIVVVEDNDDTGRKYARERIDWLRGHARSLGKLSFKGKAKGYDITDWIEEHGSPTQEQLDSLTSPQGFPYSPKSASEAPGVHLGSSWLCHRLIPSKALSVLMGAYGQGKTFVTLDMAYAIAQGRDWLSHPTKASKVLYLSLEGTYAFQNRMQAVITKYGPAKNFFWFAGNVCELQDNQMVVAPEVLKDITSGRYDLIVIDTLSRLFVGLNENDASESTQAIQELEKIMEQGECAVILVAHKPKAGTNTIRGSGAWDAAASSMIVIENQIVSHIKQRDGLKVEDFAFRLDSKHLGWDEDGFDITTCVVEPEELGNVEGNTNEQRKAAGDDRKEKLLDILLSLEGLTHQQIKEKYPNLITDNWPLYVSYVPKNELTSAIENELQIKRNSARNMVSKLLRSGMASECGAKGTSFVYARGDA